jgi:polar amino acid transport system permease protein
MNLSVLDSYWPIILGGLRTTVVICTLSILLGLVLGLGLELVRRNLRWLRVPCRIYVEFFRGSPILLQLFLLYYAGPSFGLVLDPDTAGVVGLALYGAAYFAEIFRGGFDAIPAGQLEAAESLGIPPLRSLWRIQLPQMMAMVLPALVNQAIILVKDSAVLSIITVPDLTKQTAKIINETFTISEPLLALALLYWLLVETLSRGGAKLEAMVTKHLKPLRGKSS